MEDVGMRFCFILGLVVVTPLFCHLLLTRVFRLYRSSGQRQKGPLAGAALGVLFLLAYLLFLSSGRGDDPAVLSASASIYLVFFYGAVSYVYFHFFNMSETSRRIRMLVGSQGGRVLEKPEGCGDGREVMITNRLARLVALGELVRRENRYCIGRGLLIIPARLAALGRRVLFPETVAAPTPSWKAVLLLLAVSLSLAGIENVGAQSFGLAPDMEWIPFTILGGGICVAAFRLLSPVSCLKNYLLLAAPFLSVVTGFVSADGLPGKDSYFYHFPFFQYFAESLANGHGVPTWFPLEGGTDVGFYHINNFPFLPHRLLGYLVFALLPVAAETAYKIQIVAGVMFFVWGCYAVFARLTGSQQAAFWGALCLMLGGTGITFHQEQVVATCHLLPWYTLCLLQMRENPRWIIPAGALFGLGLSTHYPQIQLIGMGVVSFAVFLWQRPSWSSVRETSRRSAHWLGLFLLLGSLPSLNLWLHSDNLAGAGRDMAHLRPSTYEEFYQMNLVQYSSAPSWYFRQYVKPMSAHGSDDPSEQGEGQDVFGLFVGRLALGLGVFFLLLKPVAALPLVALAALFSDLTLGINSFLGLPRLLFTARFPFIDVFRQWYHFFPFINICLALLASFGFQRLMARFSGAAGAAGKYLPLLVVFLGSAELVWYDFHYLKSWPLRSPPLTVDRIMKEGPLARISLFQYKDRYELAGKFLYAIPPAPFVTTGYRSTTAGLEQEKSLAIELSQRREVITDLPGDEVLVTQPGEAPYMEAVKGELRPWGMVYNVELPTRALLVADINYPLGARAYVDGRLAPSCRVNGILTGVLVEQGRHEVLFMREGTAYGWIVCAQWVLYMSAALCIAGLLL